MMRYRPEILAAHMRPCAYCHGNMYVRAGKKKNALKDPRMPTKDHIIPKSVMPGSYTAIVCRKCNNDKAGQLIDDWAQMLRERDDPRAPIVGEFIKRNAHAIRLPSGIAP